MASDSVVKCLYIEVCDKKSVHPYLKNLSEVKVFSVLMLNFVLSEIQYYGTT